MLEYQSTQFDDHYKYEADIIFLQILQNSS